MKGAVLTKRIDLSVVLLLVELGILYSLLADGTPFGTALIGLILLTVPSVIYLGIRRKKPWRRILLSTLVFGGLFGFFFEFIQEANHAYAVVSTMLPHFMFLPLDNVAGHMLMALLTFTFYEHFLAEKRTKTISKRLPYVAIIAAVISVITVLTYVYAPSLVTIPYSYALFASIAVLPVFVYLFKHPHHALRLVAIIPFFFVLYLATEMLAVEYGWWVYPGDYIGLVRLFGLVFPFEELFFWMFFYALTITVYYRAFSEKH